MSKKILIMGLPGSGKTTLAKELVARLFKANYSSLWLNADIVRTQYNDWDFSEEGRIRQGERMRDLAKDRFEDFVIADFVAPLAIMRDTFNADFVIWIDTIQQSQYSDTDKLFTNPDKVDLYVNSKNAKYWASIIFNLIV